MTDLPTRLEGAAAGSRELDAELWMIFTPGATRRQSVVESSTGLWPAYTIDETREASGQLIIVPPYTTSIDAAVALAERVLPRWGFDMGIPARMGEHGGRPWASVWPPVEDGEPRRYSRNFGRDNNVNAATPALALCAAIIRAHAEQVQG